jgi:hypothetical protein
MITFVGTTCMSSAGRTGPITEKIPVEINGNYPLRLADDIHVVPTKQIIFQKNEHKKSLGALARQTFNSL